MKCKKCEDEMTIADIDEDDGFITIVKECRCGVTCKSWYDLDECEASNTHWLNEDEEDLEENAEENI